MSSLKLVTSAKVNGTIPVYKYESERTGLKIVLAQVEGPLVNGYFTLATEAHDDDGLPHTLEHLIFLGSELYPYKGVLDLLANRCLASGTNAWTDTDHTCYTMTTAGKDGFLELLPIYLDHVLYPTLSDAGFATEVHHVSGNGDDGGVVYCEMQGRENTGESLAHLTLMRLAYPGSGYSAETGGIMDNLRRSTTNAKVRAYHAEFYRPENLTVIIAGQIDIEEVALALEPIEQRILAKKSPSVAPFVRPWQTPVEPLLQPQNVGIEFPSDEEDCGIVSVGWRGPLCTAENLRLTACSLLLRYLSDTAVSPLQREMVEVADPYASQISFSICENLESFLYLTFESVPMEKIDAVPAKLEAVLRGIAEGREAIDMTRMRSILERNVLEYLNNLEGSPHDAVAFLVIGDTLYGNTEEDFNQRLNINKQLEHLLTMNETFWQKLLKQYLIDGASIIVRSAPSIAEQQRMADLENDRIDSQRIALGPEGLEAKAAALAEATEINGLLPPNEMLTQVPIPSPESIRYHSLIKYRCTTAPVVKEVVPDVEAVVADGEEAVVVADVEAGPSNSETVVVADAETASVAVAADAEPVEVVAFIEPSPPGFNLDLLPCHAEAYDVRTNFVYMIVTLNTEQLTATQRPLLFLLLDLLTESPVRRADGTVLPYEDVVTALERDTISLGTYIGLESASQFSCGPFSDNCTLMLQVEPKKYALGVQWIADLLNRTEFTVDRIRVCASKITNAVSQARRKGNAVVSELIKALYYRDDSNVRCSSMLRQHKFLAALLEKLNDEAGAASVVEALGAVRAVITQPRNMAVHVAANWERMNAMRIDLTAPWTTICGENPPVALEDKRLAAKFDFHLFKDALDATIAPADTIGDAVTATVVEQPPPEAGVEPMAVDTPPVPVVPISHGTIVGLGCIESAFMYHATPSISSFTDPDLPALMLFLQYLTQLEGPLWRQIRGQGFAYGYNLMPRPNEALLYFTLYRATNVVAAYREAKSIVEAQLTADAVWDETLLASAKSSLIFEIIEREKSVGDLVVQALLGSFKQVPLEYNRELVRRVNEVSVEELRRVGEAHVAKLFGGGGEARTAIVCHPDKTADVAEAFAKLGRNLTVEASLEDSVLGQC